MAAGETGPPRRLPEKVDSLAEAEQPASRMSDRDVSTRIIHGRRNETV